MKLLGIANGTPTSSLDFSNPAGGAGANAETALQSLLQTLGGNQAAEASASRNVQSLVGNTPNIRGLAGLFAGLDMSALQGLLGGGEAVTESPYISGETTYPPDLRGLTY